MTLILDPSKLKLLPKETVSIELLDSSILFRTIILTAFHCPSTSLGSSFKLDGSTIKVVVGPFMPNFVMTQTNYTSKGNDLTNPAVRLIVEENGKTLYKGWAFAKYPTMYAFEHDEFAFQLMDYIPADVS